MPLIRYQIGDMAIIDENFYHFSEKFRYFVSVEGRTNDIFELEDGSLIYSHLWFVYFRNEKWINRFKVTQTTSKSITIELEVSAMNDFDNLRKKIETIYPNISFVWSITKKINIEKTGKFRSVVSLVENKFNKINKEKE